MQGAIKRLAFFASIAEKVRAICKDSWEEGKEMCFFFFLFSSVLT